jgi:hypothetical protein
MSGGVARTGLGNHSKYRSSRKGTGVVILWWLGVTAGVGSDRQAAQEGIVGKDVDVIEHGGRV